MKAIIRPSKLAGTVKAPPSKSCMQRACAAAWIRGGETLIRNFGQSNDDLVAVELVRALGAVTEIREEGLHILTKQRMFPSEVNCGESGLSARMFLPLLALGEKDISIRGQGSLLKRPFGFFDKVFPELGVQFRSRNGFLPAQVKGPLVPGNIRVSGAQSSQFLTGLLMAYVAAGAERVSIEVTELVSKPYIDLTLSILEHFNLPVPENRGYREFYFEKNEAQGTPGLMTYEVECDWSNAAFLLVAGVINGDITVRGLDILSLQADRGIVDILMEANAAIAFEAKGLKIRTGGYDAIFTDATNCPDLFPPLVALASFANGTSEIRGVRRLFDKESNRAETLRAEFEKMGVKIEINEDLMRIQGGCRLQGGVFNSHSDHRIAMAIAIAALRANEPVVIEGAEAVKKSYPEFFNGLRALGADITLQ